MPTVFTPKTDKWKKFDEVHYRPDERDHSTSLNNDNERLLGLRTEVAALEHGALLPS